ncbi:MAG: protein kinase [Sandaracinus sp.]
MAGLPTLAPGTVFARDFQVVGLLAEGGMGAVYVVEQISTGKRRALKIMLPQLVEDRRARERFAMEARIGAQIQSEHIVDVVAAGVDEATQTPWLAMEMLEGQDLSQLMRVRGRLPLEEVVEMLQQLGEGLGPAHAKGIVHRDLKPENLFIAVSRRRGVPFTLKVLDFGIAKLTQESRATASATAAIGSPMWMAPEQTEQSAQLRPATDVWAIGLIAFFMLTGRYYWRVANEPEVRLTALFTEVLVTPLDPPTVRAAQAGLAHLLPPGFDVWFSRCVARAPEQRYADAAAAIAAIGPGFSLREPTGPVSFPATEVRRPLVAPTLAMPVVSRSAPPLASVSSSAPYPPGPSAAYTPTPYASPHAPAPYATGAPMQPAPHHTTTPYAVHGPSTATGNVTPPSRGIGRTVALVAGLFLLGAGGAAATLGALIFYDRWQSGLAGGGTSGVEPPAAVDAGLLAEARVDAAVPVGVDLAPDAGTAGVSTPEIDPTTEHGHHDHLERPRPPPSTTVDGPDDGADEGGGGYAWTDGGGLAFNGTYSSGEYRYVMTFDLTRSGSSVTGSIFVVCQAAPADQQSIIGRSAMEWVNGTWSPSGALTLSGRSSTDESVWSAGNYRLRVPASGAVSGRSTGDGGRISGHI